MQESLLVGEVAKLVGISAHTIRYYEKEGLIAPHFDPVSGYRLFDLETIFTLLNIIILRDSGIAIKDIKALQNSFSVPVYLSLLQDVTSRLDKEIHRLQEQQQVVQSTMALLQKQEANFAITTHLDRYYDQVESSLPAIEATPRQIYTTITTTGITNLMYKDMVFPYDDPNTVLFQAYEPTSLCFMAGDYLEYATIIDDEQEIEPAIQSFTKHAFNQNLTLGPIYIMVTAHSMLVVEKGQAITIFAKIIDP